jgi:hypothetical protein
MYSQPNGSSIASRNSQRRRFEKKRLFRLMICDEMNESELEEEGQRAISFNLSFEFIRAALRHVHDKAPPHQ